ncbi:MAG: hypothetical protein K9K66_19420 [Desulfarculaceae bacterium]|nr:hypothetical protein [Desulfarculaceae bacterium]MCF8074371.1 hypothetical protein [Desulfarculaceae bacterium]MCF8103826.1 hypothetical protein [Desulfarculaceae bacterium]MCF8118165.1 hypothetical protein [Desulfarculaceae bacterium]
MRIIFVICALLAGLALAMSLPALAKPPGGVPPGQAKKMGAGAHGGGPPPWAPAHGYRAKHQYRYYPGVQVYFDTGRKLYFWLSSNGSWQAGASLPGGLTLSGSYINLDMDTAKPFQWHKEVVIRYPPLKNK